MGLKQRGSRLVTARIQVWFRVDILVAIILFVGQFPRRNNLARLRRFV